MSVYCKNNNQNNDSLFKEASGLDALRDQLNVLALSFIKVPELYSVSESELIIEKINGIQPREADMVAFGKELAMFHAAKTAHYGGHENNFIGLSPQTNQLSDDWGEFFIRFRLMPQIAMISNTKIRERFNEILSAKREVLSDYLNQYCAHPSLLHGDMWSGNVLFDESNAWLIDPAVYCGDSEVDIAMTEMFGGFSADFYTSYNQTKALTSEYPKKKQIYNLYHYLNHFNLFGSGYIEGCERGFNLISKL